MVMAQAKRGGGYTDLHTPSQLADITGTKISWAGSNLVLKMCLIIVHELC